jgi:hypothetical protein
MDRARAAAAAGVLFAAAAAFLVGATYALLDPTAVGPYFAAGPASPLVVALFALVGVVVLAAGAAERSDPALMAGAALVLGAVSAGLAWWWALSVSPSLVGGLTDAASFDYHRWTVALAATGLLAASAAYARAVL